MDIVGKRMKGLRESIRLSQKEISVKIGISQSAVNRYENNQSEASYETLLTYADYFDVSLDYFHTDLQPIEICRFFQKVPFAITLYFPEVL